MYRLHIICTGGQSCFSGSLLSQVAYIRSTVERFLLPVSYYSIAPPKKSPQLDFLKLTAQKLSGPETYNGHCQAVAEGISVFPVLICLAHSRFFLRECAFTINFLSQF